MAATVVRAIKTRRVQFWLPLANPETLFTCSSWGTAINYVADHLREQKLKSLGEDSLIRFSVETFDFLKFYNKGFDFGAIKKRLSEFCEVEYNLHENNDRDDEPQLLFAIMGKQFIVGMYQGAMKFCMTHDYGSPDSMPIKKFMGFAGAIEDILMGSGDPMRCNVSMVAKLPHTKISVSCAYRDPPMESGCKTWRTPKSKSRFVPPDFSIIFDR
jgi:hypothetical protein